MSENAAADLDFDVADRLRKALRFAGLGVGEMADYLGVSRNTVGRYINGHVAPDRRTLRLWAIHCRVPYDWLIDGLPRVDSNHQPAGWTMDGRTPEARLTRSEIIAFQKSIKDQTLARVTFSGR